MLHVLTGSAKGKKLKVPKGFSVRPTAARMKKSIFDTLCDIEGLSVLDLFAGTGTLGIEALSRGAGYAVFVEKSRSVFRLLRENVVSCGFAHGSRLICCDYKVAVERLKRSGESFDLIFVDPPYPLYGSVGASDLVALAVTVLKEDGVIVIKHTMPFNEIPEGFHKVTKYFGDTLVSFVKRGGA
jgi:16S rRNA (guanine(966)-N(2))-methyltransferase RsmD